MDLALIVIIAIIAVVLILQVVVLAQIAPLQKALREIKEIKAVAPPAPAPSNDRFERKGGDFRRHEKRPHAERPPRPPMPNQAPASSPVVTPAADPVETSLRDINLRLKNAERDQEYARKKIQENLGDRDHHHRGHDRGDRGNERFRDGGDRNRGGRDRNRGPRRDNWQDRNRQMPPQSQSPAASPLVSDSGSEPTPAFERKEFLAPVAAPSPVEQMAPAVTVAPPEVAPAASQEPADFNGTGEGFEHGRKVFVKRRPLRDESGEGADASSTATEATSSEPSAGSETTEIQFGRRKGV